MDEDDVFYESLGETICNGDASATELEKSPDIVVTDIGMPVQENDQDILPDDEIEGDALDKPPIAGPMPNHRIEVVIPELPLEKRSEYVTVRSEIVEFVNDELPVKRGKTNYNIEFTDGREELVSWFQ